MQVTHISALKDLFQQTLGDVVNTHFFTHPYIKMLVFGVCISK